MQLNSTREKELYREGFRYQIKIKGDDIRREEEWYKVKWKGRKSKSKNRRWEKEIFIHAQEMAASK
jgi:predicted pyridoxine 5'-phosphate oxidase superfamily flavin-nucleotide-binding protein